MTYQSVNNKTKDEHIKRKINKISNINLSRESKNTRDNKNVNV